MDPILKICEDLPFLGMVQENGIIPRGRPFVEVPIDFPLDAPIGLDPKNFSENMTIFRSDLGVIHVYMSCGLFSVTWRPVLGCPQFETSWLSCLQFSEWALVVLPRLWDCKFGEGFASDVLQVCRNHSEYLTEYTGPVRFIPVRTLPSWGEGLNLESDLVSFWSPRVSAAVYLLKGKFSVSWLPLLTGPDFSTEWASAHASNFAGWVGKLLAALPTEASTTSSADAP